MMSTSSPSANEPAKDLILARTVHLKPIIKAYSSRRMVSSGISIVIASVHSEKTRLKKLMMMMIMITRAKTFLLKKDVGLLMA